MTSVSVQQSSATAHELLLSAQSLVCPSSASKQASKQEEQEEEEEEEEEENIQLGKAYSTSPRSTIHDLPFHSAAMVPCLLPWGMTHGGEIIQPLRICGLMLTQQTALCVDFGQDLRTIQARPRRLTCRDNSQEQRQISFRVNSVGGTSTLALASRVFSRLCLHDVL